MHPPEHPGEECQFVEGVLINLALLTLRKLIMQSNEPDEVNPKVEQEVRTGEDSPKEKGESPESSQ